MFKVIAIIAAAASVGFAGSYFATGKSGCEGGCPISQLLGMSETKSGNCCDQNLDCCNPPQACCSEAKTAKKKSCCSEGADCCATEKVNVAPKTFAPDCCFPGSPCCTGGDCCLTKQEVKITMPDCCFPGSPCCEGGDCCLKKSEKK